MKTSEWLYALLGVALISSPLATAQTKSYLNCRLDYSVVYDLGEGESEKRALKGPRLVIDFDDEEKKMEDGEVMDLVYDPNYPMNMDFEATISMSASGKKLADGTATVGVSVNMLGDRSHRYKELKKEMEDLLDEGSESSTKEEEAPDVVELLKKTLEAERVDYFDLTGVGLMSSSRAFAISGNLYQNHKGALIKTKDGGRMHAITAECKVTDTPDELPLPKDD